MPFTWGEAAVIAIETVCKLLCLHDNVGYYLGPIFFGMAWLEDNNTVLTVRYDKRAARGNVGWANQKAYDLESVKTTHR